MSAELIETLRSIGYLEADGESVPNQFEYVEPKKSAGGYLYLSLVLALCSNV